MGPRRCFPEQLTGGGRRGPGITRADVHLARQRPRALSALISPGLLFLTAPRGPRSPQPTPAPFSEARAPNFLVARLRPLQNDDAAPLSDTPHSPDSLPSRLPLVALKLMLEEPPLPPSVPGRCRSWFHGALLLWASCLLLVSIFSASSESLPFSRSPAPFPTSRVFSPPTPCRNLHFLSHLRSAQAQISALYLSSAFCNPFILMHLAARSPSLFSTPSSSGTKINKVPRRGAAELM